MKTRTPGNSEGNDDLKRTVAALVEAQMQTEALSIDQLMALGEALGTELRQASTLQRFELRTSRGLGWTIEPHSLDLLVGTSCHFDDDIPF
jgi:hypothetical protein